MLGSGKSCQEGISGLASVLMEMPFDFSKFVDDLRRCAVVRDNEPEGSAGILVDSLEGFLPCCEVECNIPSGALGLGMMMRG
jgi:hypothetical protein